MVLKSVFDLDRDAMMEQSLRVRTALGDGGQGRVYHAFDLRERLDVAVKVVGGKDLDHDPHALDRAAKEFHTLKQAGSHPNLLSVHKLYRTSFQQQRFAFFSMELCPHTLANQLPTLPIEKRVQHVRECLDGIIYLHERKVAHCDIKPKNMLLSGDGMLKIGDFGTARSSMPLSAKPDPSASYLIGTPGYIAPELWDSSSRNALNDSDHMLSDQYSAGISIYEILSGGKLPPRLQALHGQTDPQAYALVHQEGVARNLTGTTSFLAIADRPGSFPNVDAVLFRMLELKPAKRFSTLPDCLKELSHALSIDELLR